MAAQSVGFFLFLVACLLALASPAPLSPVTSQEDDAEALSKTLNLVQPERAPLTGDVEERTPLAADEDVDDAPRSYVDASVFRKSAPPSLADVVKPKVSFFVKKIVSSVNKDTKEEREAKKDVLVPSGKLEPPVEDKAFDVEVIREVVVIEASSTTTEAPVEDKEEVGELPRLSPPIWLHSSLAEAMSDPLRLPLIEPYDRYDRYSHSIARDALW